VFKWINNGKEEVGEKEKNWVGLGGFALDWSGGDEDEKIKF